MRRAPSAEGGCAAGGTRRDPRGARRHEAGTSLDLVIIQCGEKGDHIQQFLVCVIFEGIVLGVIVVHATLTLKHLHRLKDIFTVLASQGWRIFLRFALAFSPVTGLAFILVGLFSFGDVARQPLHDGKTLVPLID